MGDVATHKWVVWDSKAKRFVRLRNDAVVRRNHTTYRLRRAQWLKLVVDGEHGQFGGHVAFKIWKRHTSTIAVVKWPAPEGSHQLESYVWCVRFEVESDPARTNDIPDAYGKDVLWPLEPEYAKSLYMHFQDQAELAQSSLLNYLPHNVVHYGCDYPFPWACHPWASKEALEIPSMFERLFLSSIQPCGTASEAVREKKRLAYVTLPKAQLGGIHCIKSELHIKKMIKKEGWRPSHVRPFDRLSDDLVHLIVWRLATEYIYTPAYGAHCNWTALRAVSRAFCSSANEAAADFICTVYSRIRSVEDLEDQRSIIALRNTVVPTGLDLWWLCRAYREGVMAGHNPRPAILCYMRARSGKDPCECVPLPPVPPPQPPLREANEPGGVEYELTKMYKRYGPSTQELAIREQELVHGTRSKAPLCPGVTLKLNVKAWQLRYMANHGWRVWDDQ